jgi:hypothetical protein
MAKKAVVAPRTFEFKLGKKPARRGAVKFKLAKYLVKAEMPTPPKVFGHQTLVGNGWGILGNKDFGDCVWAGAAHETMLWNKEANKTVAFSDDSVLGDYSTVTGFKRNEPDTDQGTDMQVAASYRRKTGVLDAHGRRHKVRAYLALSPGNVDQLILAMYLFGAVGIGIKFPDSAMDQFIAGKPWDVKAGPPPTEGHYIPGVGRDAKGNIIVVTWGKLQLMTPRFYKKYCDEVVAYVSEEMLVPPTEVSLEGFNLKQLTTDLAAL